MCVCTCTHYLLTSLVQLTTLSGLPSIVHRLGVILLMVFLYMYSLPCVSICPCVVTAHRMYSILCEAYYMQLYVYLHVCAELNSEIINLSPPPATNPCVSITVVCVLCVCVCLCLCLCLCVRVHTCRTHLVHFYAFTPLWLLSVGREANPESEAQKCIGHSN